MTAENSSGAGPATEHARGVADLLRQAQEVAAELEAAATERVGAILTEAHRVQAEARLLYANAEQMRDTAIAQLAGVADEARAIVAAAGDRVAAMLRDAERRAQRMEREAEAVLAAAHVEAHDVLTARARAADELARIADVIDTFAPTQEDPPA